MDAQDLEIIRALGFRPNEASDGRRKLTGPWDIAKGMGLHGTTVKRRVEQMQKSGVLQGLHMLPHFSFLGLQDGLYLFTFPSDGAKRKGFAKMQEHQRPGGPFFTARIESFLGEQAKCVVAAPAHAKMEDVVAEAADEFGAVSWDLLETHDWPLGAVDVKDIDRRIVNAFYMDAMKPITEVAQAANVTPKTVRLRMKRLIADRAVEIFPDVSPARIKGLVPHLLLAQARDGAEAQATAELANAFPQAFLRCRLHARRPFVYLAAQDTAEISRNLALARSLPSIKDARALLIEDSLACENHAGTPPLGAFLQQSIKAVQ